MSLPRWTQTFTELVNKLKGTDRELRVGVEFYGDGHVEEWDVTVIDSMMEIDGHLVSFETKEEAYKTAEKLKNKLEYKGVKIK